MAVLDILLEPHPILREEAKPVENVDERIQSLLKEMLETMYKANGIGLAANQVGLLERLVVMDVPEAYEYEKGHVDKAIDRENKKPLFLVNPEIIWVSDEKSSFIEDCLSVPLSNREDMKVSIERPSSCRVTYLDENGQRQEILCQGLQATCIQHEIDHLNGILYFDHFSFVRRQSIKKKLEKLAKERENLKKQNMTSESSSL